MATSTRFVLARSNVRSRERRGSERERERERRRAIAETRRETAFWEGRKEETKLTYKRPSTSFEFELSRVSTVAVNRASGELVDPRLVHLVAMMPRQRSLMANNTTDRYRETGFERDGRRGKNKTRDSLFCWRRQSLVM